MLTGRELVVPPRREVAPSDTGDAEERRWVQATLDGDRAAFDSLVERHWWKIASVAGRFLSDPNDVEDTVQETFVRAYEHLRHFRGEASVRTWLIRIAVNLCKARRSGFWHRRVSLTDDPAALDLQPADAQTPAEAVLLQAEWEQVLGDALQRLPDHLRLPIILHFFEELTGAEIAAVLGWNQSTVWTRIYAGCRQLRKNLADYQNS
jgi:RNA polymerase sigma-70 factor (ECF subfamily)